METHETMKLLLKKYLSGDCTPEERHRVEQCYNELDIRTEQPSAERMESDLIEIRDQLPVMPVKPGFGTDTVATPHDIGHSNINSYSDELQISLTGTPASRGVLWWCRCPLISWHLLKVINQTSNQLQLVTGR